MGPIAAAGPLASFSNGAAVPADTAAKAAFNQAGGNAVAAGAAIPAAVGSYAAGVPVVGATAGYAAVVPGAYAVGVPVVRAAVVPATYAAHSVTGLIQHPNGAIVPVEPADVQAARAKHMAAQ